MDSAFLALKNALFYDCGSYEGSASVIHNEKIYSFPGNGASLFEHGQKATFGKASTEVLDESYRKAMTIKTEDFETTFDVNKIYPNVAGFFGASESLTVSLQRYRVNMYGEGGMFKDHQDTPRGTKNIGTLVVCFPCKFEGGKFRLRNGGIERVLDWAPKSETHIQWAVFFGDVTHSIEEVTSGCRVTLAYNVFRQRKPQRDSSGFEEHFRNFVEEHLTTENHRCDDYFNEEYFENRKRDNTFRRPTWDVHPHNLGAIPGPWFAIPLNHKYASTCGEDFDSDDLKGNDESMFRVLQELGYNVEFGWFYSTRDSPRQHNNYKIMKKYTEAPEELHEVDLFDLVVGQEFYYNVCFIAGDTFRAEHIDTVTAYGNEPSMAHIYESVLIMVRPKQIE